MTLNEDYVDGDETGSITDPGGDEVLAGAGSYERIAQPVDATSGNGPFDGSDACHLVSQQSHVEGTTGWIGAIFLIVNAALGAGLLEFPSAFDQAGGLLISLLIQAILCTFAILSLLILAYCAKKHSCSTYQEVIHRCCGRMFERVCSFLIAIYCYGTCVTFLVITGDLAERIMSSRVGTDYCHHWYMTRAFMITVVAVALMLPMCFSKKIDFLKWPSTFGVVAVLYIVGLILYEYFYGGFPKPDLIRTEPDRWEDVFNVVPVICFGYQCHVSSVPIYACMKDKRLTTFSRSIIGAIIICVTVYSLAGVCGYLTFGSKVAADVLEQYDAKSTIVLVGLIALGLKIVTTYPILMFCGRLAFEDLAPKAWTPSSRRGRTLRRSIISTIWFFSVLAIACAVPSIDLVISCIGSLAALFIFVFPAMALLQVRVQIDPLYRQGLTKLIIVYCTLSVALGTFLFGQVFSRSIWQMVTGEVVKNKVILCI